jgi:hypothetical protein
MAQPPIPAFDMDDSEVRRRLTLRGWPEELPFDGCEDHGSTTLMNAVGDTCGPADLELAAALLLRGVDINARESYAGLNALFAAHRNPEALRFLAHHGIEADIEDVFGQPLAVALFDHGHILNNFTPDADWYEALFETGIELDRKGRTGLSLRSFLAGQGHFVSRGNPIQLALATAAMEKTRIFKDRESLNESLPEAPRASPAPRL